MILTKEYFWGDRVQNPYHKTSYVKPFKPYLKTSPSEHTERNGEVYLWLFTLVEVSLIFRKGFNKLFTSEDTEGLPERIRL